MKLFICLVDFRVLANDFMKNRTEIYAPGQLSLCSYRIILKINKTINFTRRNFMDPKAHSSGVSFGSVVKFY